VTSPQAFTEIRNRNLDIFDKSHTIATIDHNIPTYENRKIITNPESKNQITTLRKNCKDFGIKIFDIGSGNQGIVHVMAPENGMVQPGITIVCGDSHTSTHGAFGAIAFGIGTTEISHVMATGCMLQQKPKTMCVKFKGNLQKGVTAKDMILKLIQKIGIGGGTGYIIEYTGESIKKLSMEERMTICNMSIECGARAGLISPDKTTFDYLKNKTYSPKGKEFDKAIKYWQSLSSDKNSKYDKTIEIDISKLSPMVTWGINPSQTIEIDKPLPNINKMVASSKDLAEKAYLYTKLNPEKTIEGTKIDYVFIGSCTNGRIYDLEQAAEIFKGKKVKKGITVYIVPGSEKVKAEAIKKGLDKIFKEAGADFRNPGCSMCLAMNGDSVPEGKRCASTSNRNFIGRQGKGSITHLMSPIMAAAAAITGEITDVRKLL